MFTYVIAFVYIFVTSGAFVANKLVSVFLFVAKNLNWFRYLFAVNLNLLLKFSKSIEVV